MNLYKKTGTLLMVLSPAFLRAQEQSIADRINEKFGHATGWFVDAVFSKIPITDDVGVPWVVVSLFVFALVFTFYFKGVNIFGFKLAIDVLSGKYDSLNNDSKEVNRGEVSHFQALSAALSGTVGLGNIAGVAIAISWGGPGATFWMIMAGFFGMTSKFAECTLGVKYRDIDREGTVYGGPMYYLKKGLAAIGKAGLGRVLSVFFAIMCVGGSFGGGNMFQSNQAAQIFNKTFGFESNMAGFWFGVVMAMVAAMVIIGGIKKIAAFTEKMVPFMITIYLLAAFVVIGYHISDVPMAFVKIFEGAFRAEGVVGGFLGAMIQGLRRAAFSNEAGVGTAAIPHAAVKTKYPASEGIVALLEPFIDTMVVCTITALVIILTGFYTETTADGVALTARAFASVIPWFPYVLAIAVVLFAFSTMISCSYQGVQGWLFLFGKNKAMDYSYKTLFCIFTIIGASVSLSAVTDFSDAMIFAMSVPNLIGLTLLLPKVKDALKNYIKAIKDAK